MDLARHEAIDHGRRGRAEALLENLEDWYAARLQSSADLIHHRIRRAHVDARALAQQFRVDIRRDEPAQPIKTVAASRAAKMGDERQVR